MATRVSSCNADKILRLLDSDSDIAEVVEFRQKATTTSRRKEAHRLRNIKDDSDSDTENIFDHVRKRNALQKEKASLRIRLRRSTEQSQYKIDTDSEYERPSRKIRNAAVKRVRKNSVGVESDLSQSDCKTPRKNGRKESEESLESSNQNETPYKNSRIRRPPLRLSHYYCSTLNYDNREETCESPRAKSNLSQVKTRMTLRPRTPSKDCKNYNSDSSTSLSNQNKRESRSVTKNRKSEIPSVHGENDSDASSTASRTRSRVAGSKKDTPRKKEAVQEEMKLVSPVKTRRMWTASSKLEKKEADEDDDAVQIVEEVCLAELYKRKMNLSNKTPQKARPKRVAEEKPQAELLRTPKSRPPRCSSLTPSLGKRMSALMKPMTPLQEARARLHVSAVPKSLPCREEEFNNIFTFLKGKLVDKSGGCIYISGVPGTGKTATVNEVVKCLQKLISKGELDSFNYVSINGMKLTEPRQSYVQILKQLTGQTQTWEQAYQTLERRFHNKNSNMTLLLVDELDFLCTKRQDVVYNLLDWPTKASAQLVVITIANTMDLPERVLMGRVTSRLGLTRLTFQPYNYKQLQEIVTARLRDYNAFRSEAVQLVARKVSAVSGDARRALDICRRAMEIAEAKDRDTISLQDVSEAITEMIATPKVQAIKHCSEMEQVFLQAVSSEVTRTAVEEVLFLNAYKQLESLCSFEGIRVPTVTETLAICSRLGASRLLICEHSRNDIQQKILLNVSTDDIHYALTKPNGDE